MDWSTQTHRYRDDKQGKIVGKARTRQPLGKEKGGEREGVRSATVQHTGAGASSRSLDVRVASKRDSLDLYSHSWTRMPSLGEEGGERDRFCPPPTSLLSFSPPLIRVRFFRSKTATASFYPPLPSLPLSDSTLFPPALSSFSPVSRAVVLYVWPPCVSWSLGPSLFCTSRCQTWRRRGREREGRVVNPRDPFQSSVSTIVVVFTDARFSEETSSIDASRRVRTDESWWLRTRLEWISKRIRVEWSSVLFMGCTTVNKVFGKSWDAEI